LYHEIQLLSITLVRRYLIPVLWYDIGHPSERKQGLSPVIVVYHEKYRFAEHAFLRVTLCEVLIPCQLSKKLLTRA